MALTSVIRIALLLSLPFAAAAAERVATLELGALGTMQHNGQPVAVEIQYPKDYSLDRRYPLVVWLSGGPGDHRIAHCPFSGVDDAVIAAVPFLSVIEKLSADVRPDAKKNDGPVLPFINGPFTPWTYYRAVLDAVCDRVPNIHPDKRILSGFSNGAIAIAYLFDQSGGEIHNAFDAFILCGATMPVRQTAALKGKPLLLVIGSNDNKQWKALMNRLNNDALNAGAESTFWEMPDRGHELPDEYRSKMIDWMRETVFRRGLDDTVESFRCALERNDTAQVHQQANAVLDMSRSGEPAYESARAALAKASAAADLAYAQLMIRQPAIDERIAFCRTYPGSSAASAVLKSFETECVSDCEGLDGASVETLNAFISRWSQPEIQSQTIADRLARAKRLRDDRLKEDAR